VDANPVVADSGASVVNHAGRQNLGMRPGNAAGPRKDRPHSPCASKGGTVETLKKRQKVM
jgi:hypothetical protein